MFITPTAPDAERQRADEGQQYFEPDGDSVDNRTKLVASEHLDCFRIGGRKLLADGDRGQHLRHRALFKLRRDGLEQHDGGIPRVPQIARGGVRNPDRVVVARKIVAELDFARHHADYREAHAADQNGFADRGTPAEKLFRTVRRERPRGAARVRRPS